MHIDAVGAAVDLRSADLHELEQRRLEARAAHGGAEAEHRAVSIAVSCGIEGQPSMHVASPCVDGSSPSRRTSSVSCDNALLRRRDEHRDVGKRTELVRVRDRVLAKYTFAVGLDHRDRVKASVEILGEARLAVHADDLALRTAAASPG